MATKKAKRLDARSKEAITRDWQKQLPSMGIHRPMKLLRRAGPMLVGVYLQRDSGGTYYVPTTHVHCLIRPSDNITLALRRPLGGSRVVHVSRHAEMHADAARRLAEESPIPLAGDVDLTVLVDAYTNHIAQPTSHFPVTEYEDICLLKAWCGQVAGALQLLDAYRSALSSWPTHVLNEIGKPDQWRDRIAAIVRDREVMEKCVADEIARHNVAGMPRSSLTHG